MFKFKKLWASWFGDSGIATINPPVVVPEEIKAQWKQDAAIRAVRAASQKPNPALDRKFKEGQRIVAARKDRLGATRYPSTTPSPARPSESDTDGMGGISTIVGMEYFADMVDSSPVTNDTPWDSGCGSNSDLSCNTSSWSGDGGSSDGGGASGSWE